MHHGYMHHGYMYHVYMHHGYMHHIMDTCIMYTCIMDTYITLWIHASTSSLTYICVKFPMFEHVFEIKIQINPD